MLRFKFANKSNKIFERCLNERCAYIHIAQRKKSQHTQRKKLATHFTLWSFYFLWLCFGSAFLIAWIRVDSPSNVSMQRAKTVESGDSTGYRRAVRQIILALTRLKKQLTVPLPNGTGLVCASWRQWKGEYYSLFVYFPSLNYYKKFKMFFFIVFDSREKNYKNTKILQNDNRSHESEREIQPDALKHFKVK